MPALSAQDQLRLLLGERIPEGGTAGDTFFSDDEIQYLLDSSQYGLNGAAVLGWAAKAGEYARQIDMSESGADRKLSQRYRQANLQLVYFQGLVDKQVAIDTTAGRVAGRPINWANQPTIGTVYYTPPGANRMPLEPGGTF